MPNLKNVTIVPASKKQEAIDSQNYAALWGSTFGDGPLFYNVSSGPINELGWTAEEWTEFAAAIGRQITAVTLKPENFDKNDKAQLEKLQRWATRNAKVMKKITDARNFAAAMRG